MRLSFHEIKDEELEFVFDETNSWVMEIIGSFDERGDTIQRPSGWKPRTRPAKIFFKIRRVDDMIHVSGQIDTQLFLLCSLCADGFGFHVKRIFHALYTMNTLYQDQGSEHAHTDIEDYQNEDFEITVLDEPILDFRGVLSEQIALHLPIQPKPQIDEKGDCLKCGRPQALPTPTTAVLKENPFTVLKNWKKPE